MVMSHPSRVFYCHHLVGNILTKGWPFPIFSLWKCWLGNHFPFGFFSLSGANELRIYPPTAPVRRRYVEVPSQDRFLSSQMLLPFNGFQRGQKCSRACWWINAIMYTGKNKRSSIWHGKMARKSTCNSKRESDAAELCKNNTIKRKGQWTKEMTLGYPYPYLQKKMKEPGPWNHHMEDFTRLHSALAVFFFGLRSEWSSVTSWSAAEPILSCLIGPTESHHWVTQCK